MGSARKVWRQRFDVRLEVDIAVAVRRYGSAPQALTMSDVSVAGALIVGDFVDLLKGDEVVLAVGITPPIVATVAWMEEHCFGLIFHKRLEVAQFDSLLALRSRADRGKTTPAYDAAAFGTPS